MAREDISDIVEEFDKFFDQVYGKKVEEFTSLYPDKKSLEINYHDFESYNDEIADRLIEKPDIVIEAAEKALQKKKPINLEIPFEPHVRFFCLPQDGRPLIQDIGADHVGKMICIDGLITKRTEIRPKVKIMVLKCGLCDNVEKIPVEKETIIPDVCSSCKRRTLKPVSEESRYVNLQRAEAQEPLERLRGGAPASHMELWLEDDLVNTIIPGQRVEITGILRIRPYREARGTFSRTIYSTFLDVSHLQRVEKEFEEVDIMKEDEEKIIQLSKDPLIYEKIVKSIAPSIYGHDEVKEALALQLFSGTPGKELADGGKIRSDIHILLIGDPGVSKTRMLQYMTNLAPKSIYVSGKAVTGPGLTAAAERDELGDGGWTLKAGALVLASGGLAGIDEFDKVKEEEMAAMHEIMESQSISVAKAGIVARFRAKTSILAAANPKYGRFDPTINPSEQFAIPPTILSRFDLIFPIRDIMDVEKDRRLAEHILTQHTAAGKKIEMKVPVENEVKPAIEIDLLRKYIAYARKRINPVLTDEASEKIKEYYVDLRKQGIIQGAVPITPRYIEGLVRVAEASAKARLSNRVEIVDAERATRLMDFVLKSMAMDRGMGRVDIDIIATGQPKSKRDAIKVILDIVKDFEGQFDLVELERVIEEAKKYDVDEFNARRIMDELIRTGDLYKPKPGYIKTTPKKIE